MLGKDPFADHFGDSFERAQKRMARSAIVGTLLSLITVGGTIAGIAYAVIWIHRHW